MSLLAVGTFHFTLIAFHPVRISQAIYFLLSPLLNYPWKLFINVPIYFTKTLFGKWFSVEENYHLELYI